MIQWRPIDIQKEVSLVVKLENAAWPGLPWTEAETLSDHASWPERAQREQFIGDWDGKLIIADWMDNYWQPAPGRIFLNVSVEPENEVLAKEGFDFLMSRPAVQQANELKAWGFSTNPKRLALLEELGFSVLETQPFTRFDIPEDIRMPECSLRLATFAELEAEGFAWQMPLALAAQEMVQDIPSQHQVDGGPIDEWLKEYEDRHFYNPETMFAVMDGETIAAMTRLVRNQIHPDFANTGFTGTLRAYRGQGLARAVKEFSFVKAREMGIKTLVTDNLENNPMYAINLKLGFKPWFTMMTYLKALGATSNTQ